MNKSLSVLIQDLESEIKQIILKKSDKLEEYNNSFIKKQEIIKNIDKNKYIPNLCLLSQGFKEKCQINIDKKNKKIIKYMNKQNYLKKINNRLFYNTIKKNKSEIFDRDEIQKNSKLTEYIVMERAKKYLLENPNNYNLTIFEKIKQNKYNVFIYIHINNYILNEVNIFVYTYYQVFIILKNFYFIFYMYYQLFVLFYYKIYHLQGIILL